MPRLSGFVLHRLQQRLPVGVSLVFSVCVMMMMMSVCDDGVCVMLVSVCCADGECVCDDDGECV